MSRRFKKTIYIGLLLVIFVLIILLLISVVKPKEKYNPINSLRVDSNKIYIALQDLWHDQDFRFDDIGKAAYDKGISLNIIDLYENIIYSNDTNSNLENTSVLQEILYMDASYIENTPNTTKLSQPLYCGEMVTGFVIFEKEYTKQSNVNFSVLALVCAITIVFILNAVFGLSLIKRDNSEFVELEKGLLNITKGRLIGIPVKKDSQYPQIYHSYNRLIEELKHMMQQREYTQEQRKSFLTTISHELKTPISTINAYVEGLKNGIADSEEKRQQYIDIIYEKIQIFKKLIEDFFLYTQEDENKFKYNFAECYADELIEEIFSSISNHEDSRTEYKNLLPKCIVNADGFRIEQVVMNLYNNAKKHTSEEQKISLTAYRQENSIVIEVSDNGEGIAARDLPYIFDFYYQGASAKTKDYQGVGLGLAIAKSIIDAHKGTMKVKSIEGSGTTMYVYIPVV